MTVALQPAAAVTASKHLIGLTKKIKAKDTLTKADVTHASNILNDHKNTERAAFVAHLQANENKTEDELIEGLPHLSGPKRMKAGRPKGATAEEHREVVLLAWRLKQRGLNTVEIGERLNVSNQTAGGYVREAKELLRVDPGTVDVHAVVGESLNLYDELQAMAMRIADRNLDDEVKIRAVLVAAKIQSDRVQFLQKVGVLGPEVAEHFAQMVVQQYIIAGNKADPIEDFFGALAERLQKSARNRLTPSKASPTEVESPVADPFEINAVAEAA